MNEIKSDGYRMICRIDRGRIQIVSRYRKDWAAELPPLAKASSSLSARKAFVDCELVALNCNRVSDFQTLQNASSEVAVSDLVYFVFDLFYPNGADLRSIAIEERKSS